MADHPTDPPDAALAADWVTIWHSEWAAMAADREVQEGWQRAVALWAGQAALVLQAQAALDAAVRCAWSVPPPRSAPPAAAPDPRDAALASLLDRVAELERRAAAPGAAPDPAPS